MKSGIGAAFRKRRDSDWTTPRLSAKTGWPALPRGSQENKDWVILAARAPTPNLAALFSR
jgi:hypothetical protein